MATFQVGFVIFPDLTQLDFTGPFEVLSRLGTPASIGASSEFPDSRIHVIARTAEAVTSDRGLGLVPTCGFDDCPDLDLICVPGGSGVVAALTDGETVPFVRRQAGGARYVTSVCTGAFLLGAAGLLQGRRATTHWACTDLLPLVGATYEKGRIVRDGNVLTGAGVSAGIDFALGLVAELAGAEVAKAIQLAIEYDPCPPFRSGHPDTASEAATALMRMRNETARAGIRDGIARAGAI